VHSGDNFLGVDPLEVHARRAEVRVPELTLDDVQRDAFTGELDRVSVAQLVRREATPNASLRGVTAKLAAHTRG
jgi:hypothetical protein